MIRVISTTQMRRSILAIVVGALLLATAPTQAEELVYARFADYLEALRVQMGIPGLSAAIVGRTDVLWERGFGYQDVARSVPMRPDTPVHLDGITQTLTSATILRCAEDNRLSLDDTLGNFAKGLPDPGATIRQVLSHTSGPALAPTFTYRPERLDALAPAVKACEGDSYRETISNLLDRLAMANSVPGMDILTLEPPAEGLPGPSDSVRYASTFARLSVPYAVDASRRAIPAQYSASTLTPSTGLISTVHDYAHFDVALRGGILVRPETLAEAWRVPADAAGRPLPHGLGWFVQAYNSDTVVWQFGTGGENGSSSMVVTLPARGVSLVLAANSTGLVKSFPLDKGDVTTSPFARIFLALFTR
ncbi:MAG: serine hydrolase domain-containing protein [Vicinamibacterales bacterium]